MVLKIIKDSIAELFYIQGNMMSYVRCGPCLYPDSNNLNAKRCFRDNHNNLIIRLYQGIIIVVRSGNGTMIM